MPDGGLNDISGRKPGDKLKMGDGTPYQVVKCKWPHCI